MANAANCHCAEFAEILRTSVLAPLNNDMWTHFAQRNVPVYSGTVPAAQSTGAIMTKELKLSINKSVDVVTEMRRMVRRLHAELTNCDTLSKAAYHVHFCGDPKLRQRHPNGGGRFVKRRKNRRARCCPPISTATISVIRNGAGG